MAAQILFVDDDARLLRGIRRYLEAESVPWSAAFVESGSDALEALSSQNFDVLVTDMRMPEPDGAAVIAHAEAVSPKTIRFILSGQAREDEVLKALAKSHQYLSKPCSPEYLVQKITLACKLGTVFGKDKAQASTIPNCSLPMLPSVVARLRESLAAEARDISELEIIAIADIGLAHHLFRLASSSYFCGDNRVLDLRDALNVLGIERLREILKEENLPFTKLSPEEEKGLERLNQESLNSALAARTAAGEADLSQKEQKAAFSASLFQKLGAIFAWHSLREELPINARYSLFKCILENSPAQHLGISLSELSRDLLDLWGCADQVSRAISGVNSEQPEPVIDESNREER